MRTRTLLARIDKKLDRMEWRLARIDNRVQRMDDREAARRGHAHPQTQRLLDMIDGVGDRPDS
ncbi:MAG TPA: hypothetical protein VK486_15925 [Thermoleophilaceae bacterium]|nr:hypothetical protein [Thermoleophilaceae bacterium]